MSNPKNLTFCFPTHDPDYPTRSYQEILDCIEGVPELERLHRLAMVLDGRYSRDLARTRLAEVGGIGEDDFVVAFVPRKPRDARVHPAREGRAALAEPFAPVVVCDQFALMPRLESLTVVQGEYGCSNDDVIAATPAYSWSPMIADEIEEKAGIAQRLYTERWLEHISLQAARAALEAAGRRPEEISSVIFFGMVAISELECMLRGASLRVTRSRVAVPVAVHGHRHADTNSIIGLVREDLGEVSHRTVYDVLRALTDAGLVQRIEPPGSVARYESRVGDNHHHLVRRSCGAIADVGCAVGTAPCLTAADDPATRSTRPRSSTGACALGARRCRVSEYTL